MYGIPQERDSQSTAGRRRYTANGETPSLHCQRRDAVATITAIPASHGLGYWQ